MTEPQIRALFAQEAGGEPSPTQVDQIARRRGRARLRRRRAGVAGTSALAAAAVAALVVGVVPGAGPGSHPPAAGPPAPRRFNPLVTNLSFGFLPPGQVVKNGGVEPTVAFTASGGRSAASSWWEADIHAQGRCHFTGSVSQLSCPDQKAITQLTGPAPAVDGHRAFWATTGLVWQYARDGWALVYAPIPSQPSLQHDPALQRLTLRVARHLQFGEATPHLVFPAQFSHLSSGWRIGESDWFAAGGALQAQQYTLLSATSRRRPQGGWTNAVYVFASKPTSNSNCAPSDPSTQNHMEIINGFHVVIKHSTGSGVPRQELCSAHADGLALDIQELGSHPPIGVASLFRHDVQLLGPDPAKWTENPVS